ncbi:MAG: DUF7121 family protein [Candidatus Helarchaeota archaeon]
METTLKDTKEKLLSELKRCKVSLKLNKEMQATYDLEIKNLKEIRDNYNAQCKELIQKAKEEKILRDSYNREIKQLKEKKNMLRAQISEYKSERDSKWILYREFKNQLHELLEQKRELKKKSGKFKRIINEILELDWKLQTESMDFQKERELVSRIEALQAQIDKDEKYQDIKMINLEINELIKSLEDFRQSANHYHQLMVNLFPEIEKIQGKIDDLRTHANEHHNKLMEYNKMIDELKRKSDEVHQQIVDKIKAIQLLRKGYESKLEEIKEIEARLSNLSQKEKRIKRERYMRLEEKRVKELFQKYKNKEYLSFEELGFLLTKGLISLDELREYQEFLKKPVKIRPSKYRLTDIKGLGVRDEKILINNGIYTIEDLSNCKLEDLVEMLPFKSTIKLKNWIENAKILLNQE